MLFKVNFDKTLLDDLKENYSKVIIDIIHKGIIWKLEREGDCIGKVDEYSRIWINPKTTLTPELKIQYYISVSERKIIVNLVSIT